MMLINFFKRHNNKKEQYQAIQDEIEQIKSDAVKIISNSLNFESSPLSGHQQEHYNEIMQQSELEEARFCQEHSVAEDEEAKIVYFEVDHESELRKLESKCDSRWFDECNRSEFYKSLDELKAFCCSHGRIGELYFLKNHENDKENFEKWLFKRNYWDNLQHNVEIFIKENSPVLQTEIWAKFPKGTSQVKQYVKELENSGKIAKERKGRTFLVFWVKQD